MPGFELYNSTGGLADAVPWDVAGDVEHFSVSGQATSGNRVAFVVAVSIVGPLPLRSAATIARDRTQGDKSTSGDAGGWRL